MQLCLGIKSKKLPQLFALCYYLSYDNYMKALCLFLIPFTLFSLNPDPQLLEYQKKYTLCQENNNYKIIHCLLNSNINLIPLRGGLYNKKIFPRKINELERDGTLANYVFSFLAQTRRCNVLLVFLDYLYKIETYYISPKLKIAIIFSFFEYLICR